MIFFHKDSFLSLPENGCIIEGGYDFYPTEYILLDDVKTEQEAHYMCFSGPERGPLYVMRGSKLYQCLIYKNKGSYEYLVAYKLGYKLGRHLVNTGKRIFVCKDKFDKYYSSSHYSCSAKFREQFRRGVCKAFFDFGIKMDKYDDDERLNREDFILRTELENGRFHVLVLDKTVKPNVKRIALDMFYKYCAVK